MGDKELATVGVGAGVGHAQDTGFVVQQFGVEFIFKAIARPTCSVTKRTACLDHKVGDHAVKHTPIIKGAIGLHLTGLWVFPRFGSRCEADKVGDRFGDALGEELRDNRAFGSVDDDPCFFGGVGVFFGSGPRAKALGRSVGLREGEREEQAKPK